jgi:autotransporter-associated beta strand protein
MVIVGGLLGSAGAAWACDWTGASTTSNRWSDAANWQNCAGHAPRTGDALVFPDGARQPDNVDDLAGLLPAGITIQGRGVGPAFTAWTITGAAGVTLSLEADVVVSNTPVDPAGHGPSLLVPIVLLSIDNIIGDTPGSAPLLLGNIDFAGHSLFFVVRSPITVGGTISNTLTTGQVVKTGDSVLTLGDNSYKGKTTITEGTVVATSSHAFGSSDAADSTELSTLSTLILADGVVLAEPLQLLVGAMLPAVNLPAGATATLAGPLTGGINLIGGGTLVLSNPTNTLTSVTLTSGTLRTAVAGALGTAAAVTIAPGVDVATLDLHDVDLTIGALSGGAAGRIQLGAATLTVDMNAFPGGTLYDGTIAGTGGVVKRGNDQLTLGGPRANTYAGTTTVQDGTLVLNRTVANATIIAPIVIAGGVLLDRTNQIADGVPVTVRAPGLLEIDFGTETIGSLTGDGEVRVGLATLSIGANNASTTFTGTISGDPAAGGQEAERYFRLIKVGSGTLTLTGASRLSDQAVVDGGTLALDGQINGSGVLVRGGTLAGTGTILDTNGVNTFVSNLIAHGGAISPGHTIGVLHADAAEIAQGGSLAVQVNGTAPGTGYDQLDLTHGLTLGADARLVVTRGFDAPKNATFTIVNVAPGQAIGGNFAGLSEGATLTVDRQPFTITYQGGPAHNSIVLTATSDAPPLIYYLSEGATGGFFDEDVLLANPNDTAAPVTLTFSKEDGTQVVATRTVPAQARLTVHVDQIPGLEATAASAQVQSDARLPLVVERSMFWDASYYAGHTGSAVDQPEPDWFFAEGSQGFFDTFVLVINPNPTPTEVTFTFFRENEAPVVKTMTVGATTRVTLHAGDVPDLVNRSFGIAVHATQPIMAERSMYFGTTPTRLWSGGHESAGVTATSTHWFLAEGATGGFFDTFVLLSNPQSSDAHVQVQYLLDTGETITVPKTIAANTRLTINIEAEDDVRLHNAAVSTVVTSDVAIIAERSMYWPGAAQPWGEGHNSFGVVDAGTSWGLSEGRIGGPLNFHTYILLANPQTTAAQVTVSYLRETGAPITKTYTVGPTSRFNIDTSAVTELHDESFGAIIQVTNSVPIIVERSMYWDSNGFSFSGGTNATGIRVQVP